MKKNQSQIKPSSKRKREVPPDFLERLRRVMLSPDKGGEGGGSEMAKYRHDNETPEARKHTVNVLRKAVTAKWATMSDKERAREMSIRRQLGIYRDQLVEQGLEGAELRAELRAERMRLEAVLKVR